MRAHRCLLAVALLGFAACESSVAPGGSADTLLFMQFLPAPNVSLSRIDQGRIRIEGPTPRTLTVSPGSTTTVEGLAPGTYTVALEGLTSGSVELFGETTGVPVTAGRNTTVTVSIASFVPTLGALPATAVPGEAFPVQYGTVPGATAYVVEWSPDASFAGAQSLETPNTSASLTVNAEGTVHVRVRAKNRFNALGVPSAGGSVFLREATELLLVTPPVSRIHEDGQVRLTAHRLDELGTVLPGVTFTWSSASPAIATVDQTGLVTAHSAGTVAITAAGAGRTGAAVITVTDVLTSVRTHGGHTYALIAPQSSWVASRDVARAHGGHLAVISTAAENTFLAGYGPQRKWLGFTDRVTEGEWVWIDDAPVTVTAWHPGEPNNAGDEDCAVQEVDIGWNDIPCSGGPAFDGLVEWDFQGPIGVQDVRFFQSRRYARSLVPMTWTQARDLATSLGGQLVKIESAAEHDFLVAQYIQHGPHWIGLNDRETEGTFVWADGSAPTYLNWGGEPDNAGEEDCGALWHDSQGRWNDFRCSEPIVWAIIEWGTV